jgi:hypothetical protein
MPNPKLLASLGYFSGINEIDSPVALGYEIRDTPEGKKAVYPLQVAKNVWIDNTMHLQSRTDGMTLRLAGDVYNAWSDGTTFLYMISGTLYSMSKGFAGTALVSGLLPYAPMSYVAFNDRIYYSNGTNIGYVKNGIGYTLSTPTIKFKAVLPAGKFLAHYRTRLYSAKGKVLYISDPLSDSYDTRSGYRQFDSNITMVRPVENGIFVADETTWFLKGLAPEEFTREFIEDNSVIPYTDVNVDAVDIGEGDKTGLWAVWTSTEGICIGDADGNMKNVTKERANLSNHSRGAAMIKDSSKVFQYINALRQ